jgi:predicted MPP superfamily phosphohydrolase
MQKKHEKKVIHAPNGSRTGKNGANRFFSAEFNEMMDRERKKILETAFQPDLEGLDKRTLLLERFKIPWQLMGGSRCPYGLTFDAFFGYCCASKVFFSEGELLSNTRQALQSEAKKFFLRLDVDKDGIIGPSDADWRGFVTENSKIECARHRNFSKGEPYGNRINPSLPEIHGKIESYAKLKADSIKKGVRHIRAGGRCVYQYDLPLHYLPPRLWGTRILHISDIHFNEDKGNGGKADFLASLNGLLPRPPDLVLITGDFITKKIADLDTVALAALEGLFPKSFRAYVQGNHDRRCPDSYKINNLLENFGYINLTNAHARYLVSGFPINIFGMDDPTSGRPKIPAVKEEFRLDTNIFIVHNLDGLKGGVAGSFDLVLSGHTHAGEINLLLFSGFDYLRYFSKEFLNLNKQKDDWKVLSQRTASYVSPGLGTHKLRFNTASEGVTMITLFGE